MPEKKVNYHKICLTNAWQMTIAWIIVMWKTFSIQSAIPGSTKQLKGNVWKVLFDPSLLTAYPDYIVFVWSPSLKLAMRPLRWPLNVCLLNRPVIKKGNAVRKWTSRLAAFDVCLQTAGECQWNLLPLCWTVSVSWATQLTEHRLHFNFLMLCKLHQYTAYNYKIEYCSDRDVITSVRC